MCYKDTAIEFYGQVGDCANDTIFNKLAQLPTLSQTPDIQNLNRRAKSKWYTEKISKPLSELDSPLSDYYKNSLTCNSAIKRKGKKLTSKCLERMQLCKVPTWLELEITDLHRPMPKTGEGK